MTRAFEHSSRPKAATRARDAPGRTGHGREELSSAAARARVSPLRKDAGVSGVSVPERAPVSAEARAEILREAVTMVLYVSVVEIAELAALPEAILPTVV